MNFLKKEDYYCTWKQKQIKERVQYRSRQEQIKEVHPVLEDCCYLRPFWPSVPKLSRLQLRPRCVFSFLVYLQRPVIMGTVHGTRRRPAFPATMGTVEHISTAPTQYTCH